MFSVLCIMLETVAKDHWRKHRKQPEVWTSLCLYLIRSKFNLHLEHLETMQMQVSPDVLCPQEPAGPSLAFRWQTSVAFVCLHVPLMSTGKMLNAFHSIQTHAVRPTKSGKICSYWCLSLGWRICSIFGFWAFSSGKWKKNKNEAFHSQSPWMCLP